MKGRTFSFLFVLAIFFSVLLSALIACKNAPTDPFGDMSGAASVTFTDTDMGSGELGGPVTVEHSADESMVTDRKSVV